MNSLAGQRVTGFSSSSDGATPAVMLTGIKTKSKTSESTVALIMISNLLSQAPDVGPAQQVALKKLNGDYRSAFNPFPFALGLRLLG